MEIFRAYFLSIFSALFLTGYTYPFKNFVGIAGKTAVSRAVSGCLPLKVEVAKPKPWYQEYEDKGISQKEIENLSENALYFCKLLEQQKFLQNEFANLESRFQELKYKKSKFMKAQEVIRIMDIVDDIDSGLVKRINLLAVLMKDHCAKLNKEKVRFLDCRDLFDDYDQMLKVYALKIGNSGELNKLKQEIQALKDRVQS